jgi:hypothetical protein
VGQGARDVTLYDFLRVDLIVTLIVLAIVGPIVYARNRFAR